MWIVVIVSAVMNFLQYRKSFKAMSGFNKLIPLKAVVIRDGDMTKIDAAHLVVGDIIKIKGGDKVPADLRVLSCSNLKV